jgi:DNA-binding CsgD family transcriptional regulator
LWTDAPASRPVDASSRTVSYTDVHHGVTPEPPAEGINPPLRGFWAGVGKLEEFCDRVRTATSERAIATLLMDLGEGMLGAEALGFYTLAGPNAASEIHHRGVDDRFIDEYELHGRHCDPLLAQVRARPVPRAASIAKLVRMSRDYREFSSYHKIAQYLLAPIFADGSVVGTLNFARYSEFEFGDADVQTATWISLCVSTRIAVLRSRQPDEQAWKKPPTPRELEVAALVARHKSWTGAQIGRELEISLNTVKKHLKSLHRKLDIDTRAELASVVGAAPGRLALPDSKARRGPSGAHIFRW